MYSRYIVRRTRAGNPIAIRARTETAEFYGWHNHFEKYIPGYEVDPETGTQYLRQARLSKETKAAGISLCISRSASKHSNTATYCNYFRITGEATIADIAKVAANTDVEWNWMETPSGERRSREKWLAIHDVWTQGGGG